MSKKHNSMLLKNLAVYIRKKRFEKGYSEEQLAKLIEVDVEYWKEFESGNEDIDIGILSRLSKFIDFETVDLIYLAGMSNENKLERIKNEVDMLLHNIANDRI